MKIIILILIFFTLIKAEVYPIVYSKMAIPLFKAESIFAEYIEFLDIKKQNDIYSKEVKQLIDKGFLLDKKSIQKNELNDYLKSLRKLEKKHKYLLFTLSKHLLNAIEKNDYDTFYKIANIPLKSFYEFTFLKQKVLTYYKKNRKIRKIAILENIIEDEKSKVIKNIINNQVVNSKFNKRIKNTNNIYWTSSINSNNTSTKYNGYIYSGKKNAIHAASKFLDLGIRLGGICSDKNGNIYWLNISNNTIYRSDANGENIRKIISNLDYPRSLTIDIKRERIYWSEWIKENNKVSAKISYANLDGNNRRIIINHRLKSIGNLDIDYVNNKLYITDPSANGIYTSSLEGINLKLIAYSPHASGIALDVKNNRIVWSDSSTDKIYSANLDGKNKKTLITFNDSFASPSHISIDHKKQRLIYSISINHQGIIESSDMNGNDRRIEFSAEKLYNVGGIFIR